MKQEFDGGPAQGNWLSGRVAGWLLSKLRGVRCRPPRLTVLERIALAPRHSLALVEADGRRILVATSPEGAAAFFPLDEAAQLIDAPVFPAVARSEKRSRERPGADRDADQTAGWDARLAGHRVANDMAANGKVSNASVPC
jgi:hypothetical protein